MGKISTKELYLIRLREDCKAYLARKQKSSPNLFTTYYSNIFDHQNFFSHEYTSGSGSYLTNPLAITQACPIITNLPYITEEMAHQIEEQKKTILFDRDFLKRKTYDDVGKVYIVPLHRLRSCEIVKDPVSSEYYQNLMCGKEMKYIEHPTFYVLTTHLKKEDCMQDIFTHTNYPIEDNANIGEYFYFEDDKHVDGRPANPHFMKSITQDDIKKFFQYYQEKYPENYMDVEYPKGFVKRMFSFK